MLGGFFAFTFGIFRLRLSGLLNFAVFVFSIFRFRLWLFLSRLGQLAILGGFKFRNEFFRVFLEIFYAAFTAEFYSYPFMLDDHWFAHTPKLFTTHNAHIQWIIVCNRGYFLVFAIAIAMVMTVVIMTVVVMIMVVVSTTANEQAGGNKGSGN